MAPCTSRSGQRSIPAPRTGRGMSGSRAASVQSKNLLLGMPPAYGPFDSWPSFSDWVAARAQLEDPFSYAVLDRSGGAIGIATLMEIRPAMRVIEIGHIVYAPELQRTPLATEAQFLLARYVFDALGYRRYEWKCNALNAPSRRAAERLGFTFEGILRQHMVAKGHNRDTAYYSMLDDEWPSRKRAFEKWLEPANFDADGHQKKRLSDFMEGSGR